MGLFNRRELKAGSKHAKKIFDRTTARPQDCTTTNNISSILPHIRLILITLQKILKLRTGKPVRHEKMEN